MTTPDIVLRVTQYFQRQSAWLETVLRELEHFERDLEQPELEPLAERQCAHERELEQFAREQRGLLHEWQQARGISDSDRAAVKALAARARQLSDRLNARYETAAAQISMAKETRIASVQALQRGRGMLDKYRPGGDLDPGFLDRKA